jgi:hypothetical protein
MPRLYAIMMAAGITLSAGAGSAGAQELTAAGSGITTNLGVRGGVTLDADSFNGGVHMAVDGVGGLIDLRIEPLVEIGYGSENLGAFGGKVSYLLGRAGAVAKYFVPLNPERTIRVHGGAGLSVYYVRVNDCSGSQCDDTRAGFSVGGGVEFGRLGIDAFLGLTNATPDFTLTALLYF